MSAIEDESFDEGTLLLTHRRQSILDLPLGLFRGPNSLHNFASSFTRAQLFAAHKLDADITKKRSFFASPSGESGDDELFDPDLMVASPSGERLSHLVSSYRSTGGQNNEVFYQDDIANILGLNRSRHNSLINGGIPIPTKRVYPSPSFSSVRLAISYASAATHFALKKIEDKDGKIVTVIAGQSTVPQTIMNSINCLVGVGLYALPVGLLKGGWVFGFPLLVTCCLATGYTAVLLDRALETDPTMMTYADLGYAAYGATAKLVISLLFSIDLLGLAVSLVLLFSDSLYSLIGDEVYWTKTKFKLIAFFVLTPFTFMPLPILSIFSLIGILCTISIAFLVFICGFLKSTSPGSLLQFMPTNLWPLSLPELFIALGILMAPFGGHAVFPNLKTDMRHPEKFKKSLLTTYAITLTTDASMAVIGFLMFGALCNNEVTSILLETAGYPTWIYPLISCLICIVPLAKTALNAKPIISTVDGIFGLDAIEEGESSLSQYYKAGSRFVVRVVVNALFVMFAIQFPEFDKIIGILGSLICFIVCVILPSMFYLKLCSNQVGGLERFYVTALVLVSVVLAIICTYATIAF